MSDVTNSTGAEHRCYRHPDRRGGVTCQRCDRLICPECMRQASVGFHCPECVRTGKQVIVPKPVHTSMGYSGSSGQPVIATKTLIGCNLAAFVYALATGGTLFSLDGSTALIDGGLFARLSLLLQIPGLDVHFKSVGLDTGEYYRLITSAFLHDGVIHLAFNLYAMWILGQMLESVFGWVEFTSLFMVSLFGGAFGAILLSPDSVTVGASGAVFGLLGSMIVLQRITGISFWRSPLSVLLFLNLAITLLVPGISVGGHFGGLFAGLLMGWLILKFHERNASQWMVGLVATVLSACLALSAIGAAASAVAQ